MWWRVDEDQFVSWIAGGWRQNYRLSVKAFGIQSWLQVGVFSWADLLQSLALAMPITHRNRMSKISQHNWAISYLSSSFLFLIIITYGKLTYFLCFQIHLRNQTFALHRISMHLCIKSMQLLQTSNQILSEDINCISSRKKM